MYFTRSSAELDSGHVVSAPAVRRVRGSRRGVSAVPAVYTDGFQRLFELVAYHRLSDQVCQLLLLDQPERVSRRIRIC